MANEERISELKARLADFMSRLDAMDPEKTSLEDIDQLIEMLNELEGKLK